jgi:hypothetical protein
MTDRTHSGQVVEELLAVARLLREPGLARLYTHVLRAGEVTIDDIVDALKLPRARAISDADTAVEVGVLTRIDDRPDHRFTASPIMLSVEVDGETQTVTPTLIDAVGRSPGNQDLQHLLDRYGIDTLAVALSYAIPYAEGTMSERVAVRELGLQPAFGIAVLQSLREVVLEMEVYDPYFEQIRNAREDPPSE